MVDILGHLIKPTSVDYIGPVLSNPTVGTCTPGFTLTLHVGGVGLTLKALNKDDLEASRSKLVTAIHASTAALHLGV